MHHRGHAREEFGVGDGADRHHALGQRAIAEPRPAARDEGAATDALDGGQQPVGGGGGIGVRHAAEAEIDGPRSGVEEAQKLLGQGLPPQRVQATHLLIVEGAILRHRGQGAIHRHDGTAREQVGKHVAHRGETELPPIRIDGEPHERIQGRSGHAPERTIAAPRPQLEGKDRRRVLGRRQERGRVEDVAKGDVVQFGRRSRRQQGAGRHHIVGTAGRLGNDLELMLEALEREVLHLAREGEPALVERAGRLLDDSAAKSGGAQIRTRWPAARSVPPRASIG